MRFTSEPLDFQGENLQGENFQDYENIDDIRDIKDFEYLDKKTLRSAKFSGAKLQNANFQRVNLSRAEFQGANLTNAKFEEAYLRGVKFQGANLTNAKFKEANLRECSFKGAKLHGANFEGCEDYHNTNWSEAEYDDNTKFPNSFYPECCGLIKTLRRGQSATALSNYQLQGTTNINTEKAIREIKISLQKRQGQGKFREDIIKFYEGRCAITSCKIEGVLEAAHVKPYCISKENKPENGILLRADLHTLFDLNLIIIHPYTKIIEVSQSLLLDEDYKQFNNIVLPSYKQGIFCPDYKYLDWRYNNYENDIGKSLREKFLA